MSGDAAGGSGWPSRGETGERKHMRTLHFIDVTNRLGVAQSEAGFPFLFHEVPYLRANTALAAAGAFGSLRLSGWCRAIPADVEAAAPLGLTHYNLSISTSDQMIEHKFRGRLDRA